jgi:hypothetical protein
MDIQKPVRDYLRAADIFIDFLKSNSPITEHEMNMLQAYNSRIEALSFEKCPRHKPRKTVRESALSNGHG